MKPYSVISLLQFAYVFEKQAQIALSQINGDLLKSLTSLIKRNITREELTDWVNKNNTVLGSLKNNNWIYHDYRSIVSEIQDGKELYSAYILTSQTPPQSLGYEFDAKNSAILIPSGQIPTLYLQIGNLIKRESPLPKQLAADDWLYQGIKNVLRSRLNIDDFAKFVATNKSTIDKIRRTFEKSVPTYLGGGQDGVAYDTGSRILKIFKDESAYSAARNAFNRLHTNPGLAKTEAMIYDVGVLGKYGEETDDPWSGYMLYYYIIEKMKTIESIGKKAGMPIQELLKFITKELGKQDKSKWRQLKRMSSNPDKSEYVRDQVRRIAENIIEGMHEARYGEIIKNVDRVVPGLKEDWLELYVEEVIMKYLTDRHDLHMGNLGVTNYGELRYFDPAYKVVEDSDFYVPPVEEE